MNKKTLSALSALMTSVRTSPRILKAKPSINFFLLNYIRRFQVRKVGGQVILHSHLPPLNSRAYARFVDEHLLGKSEGPSHAQIGLTNACPQRCVYCYNRDRTGRRMDPAMILRTIDALREMGVVWIGLTGGEPLLSKEIVEITRHASQDCAVKLFTTGCGLTPALASDLKGAGLFSVCVSLDHWEAGIHDRGRDYPGAFSEALRAIGIFKSAGLDTCVSAVLSKEMIRTGGTETFLEFLRTLEIDEAWLSETKPSVQAFWNEDLVITEEERRGLAAIQDRWNKRGRMTVNYLGHFEGGDHFGCNAGSKMIYIDAFGEVSPCVFTPLTFGNVRERPVGDIWNDMRSRFAPSSTCFANANFRLFQKHTDGRIPLPPEASRALAREASFSPPARFVRLVNGRRKETG